MDFPAILPWASAVPHWVYVLLFVVTATPFVPNSTLVVASAALAGQGRLSLLLVALAVLAGTLLGDHILYGAVRWFRPWTARCAATRAPRLRLRMSRLLGHAGGYVHRNGAAVLVTMRFAPCGRTMGSAAAGLGRYPIGRYAWAMLLAEAAWTAVYVGIGYGGGMVAPGPLLAVGTGLSLATTLGCVSLLLRWRSSRATVPAARDGRVW